MPDTGVRDAVKNAIIVTRAQHEGNMEESRQELLRLPIRDVLADLCFRVQEITVSHDVKELISSAYLPLPEKPMRLVRAVQSLNMANVFAYTNGDREKLIHSLVLLIAGLEDSYERSL